VPFSDDGKKNVFAKLNLGCPLTVISPLSSSIATSSLYSAFN
jgi:hypothetical protein